MLCMKTIFIYFIPITIILIGIYFSFWTEVLKDSTRRKDKKNKPYSFARAQLMWWTIIVISIFSSYYGLHEVALKLNETCLILLGISLGTMTGAKIIDNTDISNNVTRHQDQNETMGFLVDILSDENGISVHRFQALVFNFIFGVIFINEFMSKDQIVNFDGNSFALMGISSAAYVGLKLNENTPPAAGNLPNDVQKAVQNNIVLDDDLQDIDESYSLSLQNQDH